MRSLSLSSLTLSIAMLIVAGNSACSRTDEQPSATPVPPGITLEQLAEWMTGSFSSADQATADSTFFDIRLHMTRIWPDDTVGYWLYVEQAAASSLERPYRQRIYHLTRHDSVTFASTVYEMDEPRRFAGSWTTPKNFLHLAPDSLIERTGCVIYLHPENDSAVTGSTRGQECLSTLRGAAWATSEVRITPHALTSWDRGFDSTGTQVWGAESGGYVFRKLDNYPLHPIE